MASTPCGCVYLVGAGCGDADLITLRGMALLRQCDAVVYDDLIAPDLLDAAPRHALRLYMGKRSGAHSAPQADICEALIHQARLGRTVVRLKGGDPFVFGRGGEELLALRAAGIPCAEVPGVTSAIAIPAEAGIPVTHRNMSRSVHIITAHTAHGSDGLPPELDQCATLSGTLVFLMGLAQLPRLTARLLEGGRDPLTPAAVVSGGNSPHPAAVRGTLADIAARTARAGVLPPAVVVVGDVAALELTSTVPQPLSGVTVGLTGTAAITDKIRPALGALGARVFTAQRSFVEPLALPTDLFALCRGQTWLVFTSTTGVREFFRRLREADVDLRQLHACRFAVIGGATASALRDQGIRADLCPDVFTSQALAQALAARLAPEETVVLLRSAHGSPQLARTLSGRCRLRDVPLYRLRSDGDTARAAAAALKESDYLVFSSAGGVELFLADQGAFPPKAVCAAIGPVTEAALRQAGAAAILPAGEISAQGLVQAILDHRSAAASPAARQKTSGAAEAAL